MVLLTELDLVTCSETIDNQSISRSCSLKITNSKTSKKFIDIYANRPSQFENDSLECYYHRVKVDQSRAQRKELIPNFVGVNGTPTYPLTYGYARQILIVHKPWRVYPSEDNPTIAANAFLNSQHCPAHVRIPYMRAVGRHKTKMTYYEPKAQTVDHSGNPIDPADQDILDLLGLQGNDEDRDDFDTMLLKNLERGFQFDWDKPAKVRGKKCVR